MGQIEWVGWCLVAGIAAFVTSAVIHSRKMLSFDLTPSICGAVIGGVLFSLSG